jgi:adenylate cyclase
MTADGDAVDALVGDLTGQARAERAELIEWLLARDFEPQQIGGALVPVLLAANRIIGDDGTHVSIDEICAGGGLDEEFLHRLHRAVGLPAASAADTPPSRADAESVLHARAFLDLGFDPDEVVAIVRVLVEGLGRAAETMRKAALQAVLRPGATEVQLAQSFERLASSLTPVLGPMITDLLYLQLRRSFETEAVTLAERATGSLPGAREMTVAFADLVGFTELGEVVAPEQLERTAARLAELAREVLVAPVRFVKTIGDAVMFVSPDPAALLHVVLELLSLAAGRELPRLRAGIATGWAVSHDGDWYGSPVNLASRLTDVARPGSVVTTTSLRDAVTGRGAGADRDALEWSALGAHDLKGVSGPVPLASVRRTGGAIR